MADKEPATPDERPPLTANEVLLADMKWAEQHYVPRRKKDDQYGFIRCAVTVVRELFGRTPAADPSGAGAEGQPEAAEARAV